MTHDTGQGQEPAVPAEDDDDVQGNMMLPDPTTARELARARDREVQRRAEERRLVQDGRRLFPGRKK